MTNDDTEGTPGRISIEAGRCIGAGNCAGEAEDYFDQDDDDATVIVLREVVAPQDRALVRRAINICPVAAITMDDLERAAS